MKHHTRILTALPAALGMLFTTVSALSFVPQIDDVVVLEPAEAIAFAEPQEGEASSFVFVERTQSGEDGDAREVKVEVVDGKPKVWIDGKEIADDQLRNEDGRVLVLDEDGNVLHSVRIFGQMHHDGSGMMRFHSGGPFELHAEAMTHAGPFGVMVEGEAPPVMLGIYMEDPGEALCRHLNLDRGRTTLVGAVYDGLPAHEAGIEQYDIIVSIDGSGEAGPQQIRELLGTKSEGEQIDLHLIHNGQPRSVRVTLKKYDAEAMAEAGAQARDIRQPMVGEIIIPGRGDGEAWLAPGTWRRAEEIDPEQIERHIREAIEHAMEGTAHLRREAPEALQNHLEAGRERLESHMQMLEKRMEHLQKLLERFEQKLNEGEEEDDA